MSIQKHWDKVYKEKNITKVSWYQDNNALSQNLSTNLILKYSNPQSKIFDCGSGASTLVDELLENNYKNITLLDVSNNALKVVASRIGSQAKFINKSILDFKLDGKFDEKFDIWHDRAVLHFLTKEDEYKRYFQILSESVKTGGVAIIATFAPDKIRQCSNLDTKAYDIKEIEKLAGNNWNLLENLQENHQTPSSNNQLFNYFCLQKIS
jgi:cyclopropane fatty-acyl-phospholipid synthase-like methyltransferase